MSFPAKVLNVLIASPSDVQEERDAISAAIQNWNSLHAEDKGIVLHPIRWETDSVPTVNETAQENINRTVVDRADLVVGVFWTRIGTKTQNAESGTLEEIERVAKKTKHILLYFSNKTIDPYLVQLDQMEALKKFRDKIQKDALIESFASITEFTNKLSIHLEKTVREIQSLFTPTDGRPQGPQIEVVPFFGSPSEPESELIFVRYSVTDLESVPETPILDSRDSELSESQLVFYLRRWLGFGSTPVSRLKAMSRREIMGTAAAKIHPRHLSFRISNSGTYGVNNIYLYNQISSDGEPFVFEASVDIARNRLPYIKSGEALDEVVATLEPNAVLGFEVGSVQPNRTLIASQVASIMPTDNAALNVKVTAYGDILSEPKYFERSFQMIIRTEKISASDFLRMAPSYVQRVFQANGSAREHLFNLSRTFG
jgi:hypothetical protein